MISASIVRSARPEDEGQLWELFHLLHEENGLFPLDEPKVQWFLDRALHPERIHEADTGPRGKIGVIGVSSALEGVIMMLLGQFWYSTTWHLEELLNFVRPECRKSNHAKSLIAFAKKSSDDLSIPLLIGVISNVRTEAKIRLYDRQLPKAGAFYFYNSQSS